MELEIKVMWCKGLTAFNFFQKLTVYASVSIDSEDQRLKLTQDEKQEQKTPVDEDGDGNPEWNFTMKFDIKSIFNNKNSSNSDQYSLLFELRHHAQFFPDRNIGEVRVPLKELVESVGLGVVRFASYEVRGSDGKPNGVLDFSYKVIGDLEICSHNNNGLHSDLGVHITGYHNHSHSHSHHFHHHHSHSNRDHGHHYHHDSEIKDESLLLETDKIEYPKIDLGEMGGDFIPSASPLVSGDEKNEQFQYHHYPPPPSLGRDEKTEQFQYHHYPPPPSLGRDEKTEQFQYYPPPPTTATITATTHYPPPLSYPPPGPPLWAPPPAHYPPPPRQLYPPPAPSYGEPYWEYPRPPPPNYQQSRDGYENHHW